MVAAQIGGSMETGSVWVLCVADSSARLSYIARVVDPGTYAWEPAVLQSTITPDRGVVTPSTTVTIRAARS